MSEPTQTRQERVVGDSCQHNWVLLKNRDHPQFNQLECTLCGVRQF